MASVNHNDIAWQVISHQYSLMAPLDHAGIASDFRDCRFSELLPGVNSAITSNSTVQNERFLDDMLPMSKMIMIEGLAVEHNDECLYPNF